MVVEKAGWPYVGEPKELFHRRELGVTMVRMEPSIEGSRAEFFPPVGEDRTRALAVKPLPELDVRVTEGEGEAEVIGVDR